MNAESYIGKRIERIEDNKFITTGATYVADVKGGSELFVEFLRSPIAHGRIMSLNVDKAKASPGVEAIYCSEDITLVDINPPIPLLNAKMVRPYLARDRVRFVGEPIVLVVANSARNALKAIEEIEIEFEDLEAVVSLDDSFKGEVLLFDESESNVMFRSDFTSEDGDRFFDGCDVFAAETIVNSRVAPCPLEGRSAMASFDGEKLTVHLSTQAPHSAKSTLFKVLGLESENVHVIAPDVGGGFGAKIGTYPEEILVAYVAIALVESDGESPNTPKGLKSVRWSESRNESMISLGHGRGQRQRIEIGGTKEGRITHYRLSVMQDGGAYPMMGAFLPFFTRRMVKGCYDIQKVDFMAVSVATNTTPVVAYRGAGRPEATYAIERAVELFARKAGLDPADVRRKNFISEFPYDTGFGSVYDSGAYLTALEKVLDYVDYKFLRAEQRKMRNLKDSNKSLGIGISSYVEVTHGFPASEFGSVKLNSDGTIFATSGTFPHGQGHGTTFAQIIADELGLSLEKIEVFFGDTDIIPRGVGTFGSRSVQSGGVALSRASKGLIDKTLDLMKSEFLDSSVFFESGWFFVDDRKFSWEDIARLAGSSNLECQVDYAADSPTFPFGAHVCIVEVDVETGVVVIKRVVALDDAGRIINRLLADGQVFGGLAQGISQALYEEVIYDENGNPLTSTFADYGIPSATEFTKFERLEMETLTTVNELGAKGIGESGTIGITPCVVNAVCDALSHLGINHIDMPLTPFKVYSAIRERSS